MKTYPKTSNIWIFIRSPRLTILDKNDEELPKIGTQRNNKRQMISLSSGEPKSRLAEGKWNQIWSVCGAVKEDLEWINGHRKDWM